MTVAVKGGPMKSFNLTPSSPGCETGNTGYLNCQEAMSIPSGPQTLTVTLYNLTNGQGSALATATTSVTIASTGFTGHSNHARWCVVASRTGSDRLEM